jgi:hypothetical protein
MIARLLLIAAALLTSPFSALATEPSDAYQAGYNAGQKVGHFVHQLLPYIGVALVVLVVWLGWRAWSKQRR